MQLYSATWRCNHDSAYLVCTYNPHFDDDTKAKVNINFKTTAKNCKPTAIIEIHNQCKRLKIKIRN